MRTRLIILALAANSLQILVKPLWAVCSRYLHCLFVCSLCTSNLSQNFVRKRAVADELALNIAIRNGDEKRVDQLIKAGTNVNATDSVNNSLPPSIAPSPPFLRLSLVPSLLYFFPQQHPSHLAPFLPRSFPSSPSLPLCIPTFLLQLITCKFACL